MLIECSFAWVLFLNIIAWLVIQFGLAWSLTQLAPERFDYRNPLAYPKSWERNGRFYERVFAIKRWKDILPDGARMFRGGFPKGTLQSTAPEYIERFLRETWRGEIVHWLVLLTLPMFIIWNPWWGLLINAVVALALNFPCILVLRYNRARFRRFLTRQP